MSQLIPAGNARPTAWIVDALKTFGESVTSLVPAGFPAYVRVFHPAYRRVSKGVLEPIEWRVIAETNGTHAHAAMQLIPLTRNPRFIHEGQPGVYERAPREGSLPAELIEPLVAILGRHTGTPGRCWFAVWIGLGEIRADVRSAPTFRVYARDYHLLEGPIAAVRESAVDPPWDRSPNLWWPDDHAWCVATEIDLNTTYIGCDARCRDDILSASELEAAAIDPATGISWESDPLNPWPGRG